MLYQERLDEPLLTWNENLYFAGSKKRILLNSTNEPSEGKNGTVIRLSARPKDPLIWLEEIESAEKAIQNNHLILWEFDLGLFEMGFSFEEMISHNARILALEQFMKEIYPRFKEKSLGVLLYRGPIDISYLTDGDLDHALDLLSYHLTLFAYVLDDLLPIWIAFDMRGISLERQIQLLDPKRFSHYLLALKGAKAPFNAFGLEEEGKFGAIDGAPLLPRQDESVGLLVHPDLKEEEIRLLGSNYRLLYEDYANTSWDHLNYIVTTALEPSTKAIRVLQGFTAAGGRAVTMSGKLGLEGEISFKKFIDENRGRGI